MKEKYTHIEDLFKNTFSDAEVTPPQGIWSSLESSLQESNPEALYATTFKNAKVQPSSKVWQRISRALFLQAFLQFKVSSFNVYYASLIAVVGGVAGYVLLSNPLSTPLVPSIVNELEEKHEKQDETIAYTIQTAHSETETVSAADVDERVGEISQNIEVIAPRIVTVSSVSSDAVKETLLLSEAYFEGSSVICENSQTVFSLQGIPSEYAITWDLGKNAVVNSKTTSSVVVTYQKAGSYTVSALVHYKNASARLEYPITVETALVPQVRGNNVVCEGQENMLYQVEEPVNRDLRYIWTSRSNRINMTGNKYVNIDWLHSGIDTIEVIRIDDRNGCKSQGNFVVRVNPKPEVDFEFSSLGDEVFRFSYLGEANRRGNNFLWNIEGVEYNSRSVEHRSNSINSSMVSLTVTDRNRCANTVTKEIPFNKYLLLVPRVYSFSQDEFSRTGFIPQTNTALKEYRIEIFNANNVRVWESSKLVDGKPAEVWNGMYRGELLPQGRYFWQITAVFADGYVWQGIPQTNGECLPNGVVQIIER